ncbi:MAG: hypothetical protein ACRDK7_00700 [Solirubrobacteraceae bacterium]
MDHTRSLPADAPLAASPRSPRQIAILLYPGVQSLDFTGPLEVFSGAQRLIASTGPRGDGRGRGYEVRYPAVDVSVATACGFPSAETMRRVFLRTLDVGPAEYRRRFHSRSIDATDSAAA